MKILILESYPEIKREYLNYLEKNNEIFEVGEKYNNDEIEVIIIRSKTIVDKKLLDKYPNLKFVARVGVGLDKIDLDECKKRGIKVLNTPKANFNSVAELVLAGVLNLARNLNLGFKGLENRFDYMGFELSSKSVGIVGFGNIGKKIYELFKSFGVKKFFVFDPFLKKQDVEKNEFCEFLEEKNDIFKLSDIISFHIPLLDSTKNFLGEKEFSLLKKDVILVNTSRGGIIDEKKLIDFLNKNKSAKFFADVWEEENSPLPASPLSGERSNLEPKKELLESDQVLLTPHIGAMTKQAEEKMHFFEDLIF